MNTIKIGDKLTSDCGGSGLVGEMMVTKIVAADPDLDVFNAGDLVYVTETLSDETGIIRTYETFFNASKLIDGVLIFNEWRWTQTYASTIYATPDAWGSQTVYADEPTMQTTIASLIDAGGEEWAGINLDDCAEWELVQVVNGLGLYREQHVRHDSYIALWNGRALPIKMAVRLVGTMQENGGEYQEVYFTSMFGRRIATYSSLEDAIEELSA